MSLAPVTSISTRRSGAKQSISAARALTLSQVEPVTGLALPKPRAEILSAGMPLETK